MPVFVYPEDLPCRITVPQTPRNPYGIRICRYETPRGGRDERLEREVHYVMFALEVVKSGAKTLARNDRKLQLSEGGAAIVSPGPYRILESSGYSSLIVFFNQRFPCDFLQQNFKAIPVPNGGTECACTIGRAGLQWFDSSIEAIFREPKYFPCMSRVMLQEALLRMVSADPRSVKGLLATAALSDRGGLPSFMAAHAMENLPNARLASLCGKSVSAFHRQFTGVFGTTPQKWLMERRLERARSLLAATGMTVTQICHETGFKDSAHFSRAFRRRFGMSPRQARDRLPESSKPPDASRRKGAGSSERHSRTRE